MLARIIFSLLFFSTAVAQNLVPNSGFEDVADGQAVYWKQPQGGYFHLTEGGLQNGPAKAGKYYNGICLLNQGASEYLFVPLYARMVKNEKYKLGMYLKLADDKSPINAGSVKTIDWLFTDSAYNVNTRVRIKTKSTIHFTIPDKIENWTYIETEYTATGTEKYLIIGKFFEDEDSLKKIQKDINIILAEKQKALKVYKKSEMDSLKKALYSNELYLKKNKNKSELEAYKKMMSEHNKKMRDVNNYTKAEYQATYDSLVKHYNTHSFYYDVRFMFDDIHVTGKLVFDNPETSIGKKPDYKPGKTFVINNIFFETAKATLLPSSYIELNRLLKILNENPKMVIRINGHTDNQGGDAFNINLSDNRSKAVVDYLISKGIKKERLQYKGFGSSKPVADNKTESGRQKNRRVEFEILKM
jgi:outer membrane protein OmpA-like peptidoglycan-associated protein